jgi:transposase
MDEPRKYRMNGNARVDGDDAPVVREGGRSPSTLSMGDGAGSGAAEAGPLGPGQRWSVARKRAVVLRLLRGEPVELVSRAIGVPVYKLERWREKAEAALEAALKEREADPGNAEMAAALQRIGELSMENELLRAKMGQSAGPLGRRRWR